jgi:hypothetical protein
MRGNCCSRAEKASSSLMGWQLQPVAVRDAVPPSWPAKKARTSLRSRLRHDQENAHSAGKTTTMRPFRRERWLTQPPLPVSSWAGTRLLLRPRPESRPRHWPRRSSLPDPAPGFGPNDSENQVDRDDQNLVPAELAPSWLRTLFTLVSSGPAGPPDARGRWQRSRCSSGRCAAAVDSEDRAVNEAGVVGSQIGDRCGDLVW